MAKHTHACTHTHGLMSFTVGSLLQKVFRGEEDHCSIMAVGPRKLYPFHPRKKGKQFISIGKRQYSVVIKSLV